MQQQKYAQQLAIRNEKLRLNAMVQSGIIDHMNKIAERDAEARHEAKTDESIRRHYAQLAIDDDL